MEPNYTSYKDLSARVVKVDNTFYRYIFKSYQPEYDHLMSSGLYEELVANQLLITHEELEINNQDFNIYKYLLPKQMAFQSYPFEWSYSQFQKVILAYLTINDISLKYGMILKDATPYNFYFDANKAVMFDTSSFIFFKENDTWVAYKQFCELFLSPIALMHYNGHGWGKLYKAQLQGLSLNFVSKQLQIKSWFNLNVLLHIHLHSKYTLQSEEKILKNHIKQGFSIKKIRSILLLVKNSVHSWKAPYVFKNHWAKYYEIDIETDFYLNSKESIIRNWLESTKPKSVLDLGANIGRFSIIASEYSEKVISFESDEICVDEIHKNITINENSKIFPLVGDLSEPNPGLGLMNMELLSIFERAKSEMVLSLALIHHLFFTNCMSFKLIVEILSKFTINFLVVEFIPKEDRKVKKLMLANLRNSEQYNLESFKIELFKCFKHIDTIQCESSSRSLILLKKLN